MHCKVIYLSDVNESWRQIELVKLNFKGEFPLDENSTIEEIKILIPDIQELDVIFNKEYFIFQDTLKKFPVGTGIMVF